MFIIIISSRAKISHDMEAKHGYKKSKEKTSKEISTKKEITL